MATREQKLFEMPFAAVYPLYLTKITRKDRTEAELLTVLA